jgi:hypothetical protein
MNPESHQFRPSKLWKLLSAQRRSETAAAFWKDGADATTAAQAIDAIARHLNFRHKSVMALPDDRKAQHLASLPTLPDALAARLLVTYHLAAQRPMMAAFLDALGLAHDNGLIADEHVKPPDAARCQQAERSIAAAFPREDVSLYLATLVSQDEETWRGLKSIADC